ncbi:fibronectin type III domain-containing protein [Desulfoluna sp.]|uniref:fibronectin type III domain-containing protein n=1 Tax=Desulfoluna sp. TaxID=2045199 RepID=UPI00263067B3|nr:fibronectin type III domain-containing protein [Desulfoluna sp.]
MPRQLISLLFCTFVLFTLCSCGSSGGDDSEEGSSPPIPTLTLIKSGDGSGHISCDSGRVDCHDVCQIEVETMDTFTLTAVVDEGSIFGGWSGDIPAFSTELSITITVSQVSTITANFSLIEAAESRLQPEQDLLYLGAFKLPDEKGTVPMARWSGGGQGMTFYPKGDPHGVADGFPGSLFSISHTYANHVSEFSIPVPVISVDKNLDDLPRATTLQPFADITEGRQTLGLTGTTLVDIQYYPRQGSQATDKLYWTLYEYYMPHADTPYHGWAELDLSAPQSHGMWRLGDFPAAATSKYLFDVPATWATIHTPGKSLAAGRYRTPNNGSWGPALYVFGPWNDGNPPADGCKLGAIELLKHSGEHPVRGMGFSDNWVDGAWLTAGDRSAVVIAGKRGVRERAGGQWTYGVPQPDDYSRSKGYHGCPDYGALLFYDPVLIGHVAGGTLTPDEVQPYAVYNVQDLLFSANMNLPVQDIRTRGKSLGGVGYDRKNNLLYVLEIDVEGYYSPGKPIAHVFEVFPSASFADTIPPSSPSSLAATEVTSEEVILTWEPAEDNAHLAGYIVYRDGHPIDTAIVPTCTDDRVNPDANYRYTVVAFDSRNNKSLVSQPLRVTTPSGPDKRLPLITDIYLTDTTETSVTVHWKTDEPTTSKIEYGAQYHDDQEVIDSSLTRTHAISLTGLTGALDCGVYVYCIFSTDAYGNTNSHSKKAFRPARPTTDNQPPLLESTGARRVSAGDLVQFVLSAWDSDRGDSLRFSATGLPDGATFAPATRLFQWRPGPDDIGIHRMTFSVSDGDQVESETVAIVVEE